MTKFETMDALTQQGGGYLLTAAVQAAGISRTYLLKYVNERKMERIESGIYILPEVWSDELYILQLKNKEIIFSNETALYLHGLMEREPEYTVITVKQGYNATHLIKRGIKPHFIKKELFEHGVTVVKTLYGNDVKAYDIDRTICDMVRHKNEFDIQVFQTALKEYMSGGKKNIHRLMIYAEMLGIEKKIRNYTEIML